MVPLSPGLSKRSLVPTGLALVVTLLLEYGLTFSHGT